ncbi:hypothetical protein [Amphritea sp.]|uniref:hypothetical protein n=1 Tax=Amphritea sp. TaxID=1872502 RepID=UPI003A9087CD
MLSWFKRFRTAAYKPLILIDIGYPSHQLSQALLETGQYKIVAYIDEEPWSHLTQMNGANIHYPSELLALAEKNRVVAVIKFEGAGWQPDDRCLSLLANLKVNYITLASDETLAQQVERVIKLTAIDR